MICYAIDHSLPAYMTGSLILAFRTITIFLLSHLLNEAPAQDVGAFFIFKIIRVINVKACDTVKTID